MSKKRYCRCCGIDEVKSLNVPCPVCNDNMHMGILIIGVSDKKTKLIANPERTGYMFVVSSHWLEENIGASGMVDKIVSRGVTFMPQRLINLLDMLGRNDDDVVDVSNY